MIEISEIKLRSIIREEYSRMLSEEAEKFDPYTYDPQEKIRKLRRFKEAIMNNEFSATKREEARRWWEKEFDEPSPSWL